MKRHLFFPALSVLLGLTLFGCSDKPSELALGTVQVRLTDAPGDIEALHLVITEVSVHRSGSSDFVDTDDDTTAGDDDTTATVHGGWEVIKEEDMTIDLMTLQNGTFTTLGIALVPAGRYTQIRLKLGEGSDVVVDGVTHPLIVPSGLQSGLKIVHPFTVPDGGFVDLLVDIDAKTSVEQTGSGEWILKPTVKVTQDAS